VKDVEEKKKKMEEGKKYIKAADTGLSEIVGKEERSRRMITHEGEFSIRKKGLGFFERMNFYHFMIRLSWVNFFLILIGGFLLINIIFAAVYYTEGLSNIGVTTVNNFLEDFTESFIFSAQTLTTIGYGRLNPMSIVSGLTAAFEGFIGLLLMAFGAGILFARFSKPTSRILFSSIALIAPYQNITGFMFRTANKLKSQMIDVKVTVVYSHLEELGDLLTRKFYTLPLEYDRINFFESTWTVNHPIDENSPLYGLTEKDFKNQEVEFLVTISGFDDTYGELVHARNSYRYNEVRWGEKFKKVFGYNEYGDAYVDLDRIDDTFN